MKIDPIATGPELICADCGSHFRARRVTDGIEEICDACYQARFPASSIESSKPPRTWSRHLAAD